MSFAINLKTYEISTDELGGDFAVEFEPPLVFTVRSRPPQGWYDAVAQIKSDDNDIELAARILFGICLKVSSSSGELKLLSEKDALIIHEQLKNLDPAMADQGFFTIAYRLAGRLMDIKHGEIDALKKTSARSNGTSNNLNQAERS